MNMKIATFTISEITNTGTVVVARGRATVQSIIENTALNWGIDCSDLILDAGEDQIDSTYIEHDISHEPNLTRRLELSEFTT